MAWVLQENKNEGYPTNTNFPSSYTADWSGTYPWGWILQPQYNDGYPFRHPWFPTSSGGSGDGGGGDIGGDTPWEDNPYTELQEGYWTGLGGTTYISSLYDLNWAFEDVKMAVDTGVRSLQGEVGRLLGEYLTDPTLAGRNAYKDAADALNTLIKNNGVNYSRGYNANYTDCFLSCIRYPFDISQYFEKATYSPGTMTWGTVSVPNTGNPEDADIWRVDGYNTGWIVQGGELYVEKRFDNFLNYAPYTTAELYIPYCGSVPIDLEVFAGHTINVKYLVDWFSGACIALIYRDNVVVDQISGQIGTPIGIVAEDIQTYQNAMFNGSQTLKS